MTLYFSPSATAFYDAAQPRPDDAIPISRERLGQLMDEQAEGRIITSDARGQPIAVTPPPPSAAEAAARLRAERDRRLAASDYSQFPDYPITPDQRRAWATYRQALRDLPTTITNPADIAWPVPPEG
ncbi:MAG TPA: phage tail assembly chaperone [Sphingopyxis sp.]|nr:phage tail assembly chaperone [Sphingopyxis sp.]